MNGFNRHECSSWSEHFRFNVAIKETLFFYFFIFVILFAGLREIGADRDSLLYQFYYLNGYLVDNHFGFEPGFEALIYLSNKIIGLDFYLFIFMIALLSISIKFYAYKLIFRHN